jgi:hypothetical protein
MLASIVLACCTALHGAAGTAPIALQSSTGPARAPSLTIDASQREAVRAAAAPYRGSFVRIVVHRPTAQYTAFAQGLEQALRAAGLEVALETAETNDAPDCAQRPGLRITYGIGRSGAVNAIAEALIRSGIVTESISGCSVPREDEFTFILSSVAS